MKNDVIDYFFEEKIFSEEAIKKIVEEKHADVCLIETLRYISWKLRLDKNTESIGVKLLTSSTLKNDLYSRFILGEHYYRNNEHLLAKQQYEFCVTNGGSPRSFLRLASLHFNEFSSLDKDVKKALQYYTLGAERGYMWAHRRRLSIEYSFTRKSIFNVTKYYGKVIFLIYEIVMILIKDINDERLFAITRGLKFLKNYPARHAGHPHHLRYYE